MIHVQTTRIGISWNFIGNSKSKSKESNTVEYGGPRQKKTNKIPKKQQIKFPN